MFLMMLTTRAIVTITNRTMSTIISITVSSERSQLLLSSGFFVEASSEFSEFAKRPGRDIWRIVVSSVPDFFA